MTEEVKKVLYKLTRGFWNGEKLLKRGDTMYFFPDQAPGSAKKVEIEGKAGPAEKKSDKKSDK